ncbi:MAG: cellulose binding domain-containing protein [Polyangiaceae bacterium]
MSFASYIRIGFTSLCLVSMTNCTGATDDALTLEYSKSAMTQSGVTASLSIDDDWGSGFCGTVSVVNKSPHNVRAWKVELDRHGSNVGRQWGGLRVLPEDRLVVHPAGTNEQIPVGATVSVPFCGSGTGRPSLRAMQVDIPTRQG